MVKLIIIGERLNSTRKSVLKAFQDKNEKFIIEEAKKQKQSGANYLDINASMMLEKEIKTLEWVIPLIQDEIDIAIAIDTSDVTAMEAGLKVHKGRALINSISGKRQKLKEFVPLVRKYNAKAVVMCLDDSRLLKPKSVLTQINIVMKILDGLMVKAINLNDIFIDLVVHPIGTDMNNGAMTLNFLRLMKNFLPNIKTICGISNISFGMPERQLLNRIFLVLAIQAELDAAILDPLDENIVKALITTEALLGKDFFCKNYIDYMRKNKKPGVENSGFLY